ncbi:hypothetical protein Tco_0037847 [Tanacetum coccineum]
MAFVSSSNNNTSNTNGAVNTAQAVNTAHRVSTTTIQFQLNSPQLVHEDLQQIHLLQQIHPDDMEEMDLRCPKWSATTATRRDILLALVSCDGLGGYDWSDQAEEGPNYALMTFSSSSPDSEKGLGYENSKAVPPPYTGNFMPPTPDLSFIGLDEFVNKHVIENCKAMSIEEEPKVVRKNDDAPIIEEWVLDDEEEDVSQPKIEKKKLEGLVDCNYNQKRFKSRMVKHVDAQGNMTREHVYLIDYEGIFFTMEEMLLLEEEIPKGGKIIGKGSGPDWLFDIDALTRTINYEPIVTGTQSNGFVGTKASDNAVPKSFHDDGSKPSSDDGKKVDEDPRKDSKYKDQEKEDNVNSTNNVNAASTNEVNVVGGKTSIELPFDLNMPAIKDYSIFDFSRDDEDDGAVADMNNLDTTIQVSPILTTRIHKDHPLDQVIGDLQSATQTRKMSKNLEEHGKQPKRLIHALKDQRDRAMQEELYIQVTKMYLKGQPKLGLWYLKDSPLDLVAYTYSDYARASLDRKSTTRGCQFLRCRLILWQCKKQTVVANSITEAEYVAALSCCGQVKTINGEVQLHALVDDKKIIITEASVRTNLQLADEEDVDCLANSTIFEQLTLMGV